MSHGIFLEVYVNHIQSLIQSMLSKLWVGVVFFALIFGHMSVSIAEETTREALIKDKPQQFKQIDDIASPKANERSTITLLGAVKLMLQHNPELSVVAKEANALKGITLQAGLLPNPELFFDIEDLSARTNGPGSEFVSIRIGQLIELGGKRSARSSVASLGQESMMQEYEAKRLALIAQTANLFADVLSAQEQLKLVQSRRDLAQQVMDTAKKRVFVGEAPPVEEIKSSLALATTEIELKQAQRNLNISRKQLAMLWGNSLPTFSHALGDLESFVEIPALHILEAQLLNNPQILRRKIILEQRKASLVLEEAQRIPDVTINAGVRRFTEDADTAALVGLAIPLPIFNRNQGNIMAAHERVDKATDESSALTLRLENLLIKAYEDLIAVQTEITLLRDEILPGAKSAFEVSRRGYELGKFGFLEMLDAQRTLFQNQTLYLRALTNYQYLVNEIERLIAAPIDKDSMQVDQN